MITIKSYYGELCTKMYEKQKSIADETELNFYLSFVNSKDDRVLEPMCGNGRMLIPFLQNGVCIEGFDISAEMLEVCQQKANRLGYEANVYYAKIEEFEAGNKYDLILIPYGSISLLPDTLLVHAIANMKRALKDDGKIVLTIMLKPDTFISVEDWVKTDEIQLEDEKIILYKKQSYDALTSIQHTTLKYVATCGDEEKIELMDFPMRLFAEDEFISLLQKQGIMNVKKHIVENGYDQGQHFVAYECTI